MEKIEIKVYPYQLLTHKDPTACDRVISLFNTRKNLPVPLTRVNRELYNEMKKEISQLVEVKPNRLHDFPDDC